MDREFEERPAACPIRPAGPPDWRYKCYACEMEFEMPAPKGPSEEKARACPRCGSHDIAGRCDVSSEACPPGG